MRLNFSLLNAFAGKPRGQGGTSGTGRNDGVFARPTRAENTRDKVGQTASTRHGMHEQYAEMSPLSPLRLTDGGREKPSIYAAVPPVPPVPRINETSAMVALAGEHERCLRAWLASISETDADIIADVLTKARDNQEAREYFLRLAAVAAENRVSANFPRHARETDR